MKIATVTTLRCPPAVARAFVHYHRQVGIGRMYLYFDDPAPGMVLTEPGEGVEITVCGPEHYEALNEASAGPPPTLPERQSFNAADALRRAREEGVDFLFHIDADELVYAPRGDIPAVFSDLPPNKDVVVFRTAEAIPEGFECSFPFADLSRFREQIRPMRVGIGKLDWRLERFSKWCEALLVRSVGGGAALFENEHFRGHTMGKAAVRVSARVARIGNHRPVGPDGAPLRTWEDPRGRILHYDSVTCSEWRSKWDRRLAAEGRSNRMRRNRNMQGRAFEQARSSGDAASLRELYRTLYFVPPELFRRLAGVGLARRITLPREILGPWRAEQGLGTPPGTA